MAARSIASLTISFGLVAIPVKLYSATEASQTISFNLLHKTCGSRVRQQYFCAKEDIPITRDEMVKGYEFAKDQYVMFTPEELKALEETGTHSADITDFVPISTVDPVYFDKSYYLAPDKGGAKPYALLAKALRESKRCAIGHWATRGKQYIVMIRPVEDGLVMQQLLYAKEVRAIRDLDIPVMDVREAELKLAKQLIEQQSSAKFDPAAYHDDVSARIQKAIDKKVEGHEISVSEAPEGGGGAQIIDLMEALRASLDKKSAAKTGMSAKTAASVEAETKVRKPPKRAGASPAAPAAAKKAAKK